MGVLSGSGATSEFRELVEKTAQSKPAQADVLALRKMLAEHPGLWRFAGDVAQQAATRTIESLGGPALVQESLAQGLAELKEGLGYETALERTLIEQVALTWLRLHVFECRLGNALNSGGTAAAQLAFWHERATVAQRRYLQA